MRVYQEQLTDLKNKEADKDKAVLEIQLGMPSRSCRSLLYMMNAENKKLQIPWKEAKEENRLLKSKLANYEKVSTLLFDAAPTSIDPNPRRTCLRSKTAKQE